MLTRDSDSTSWQNLCIPWSSFIVVKWDLLNCHHTGIFCINSLCCHFWVKNISIIWIYNILIFSNSNTIIFSILTKLRLKWGSLWCIIEKNLHMIRAIQNEMTYLKICWASFYQRHYNSAKKHSCRNGLWIW